MTFKPLDYPAIRERKVRAFRVGYFCVFQELAAWNVSHIRSGAQAGLYNSRQQAIKAARELNRSGFNWKFGASKLVNPDKLALLKEELKKISIPRDGRIP